MAGPSPNKVSTSQLVGKFLKFAHVLDGNKNKIEKIDKELRNKLDALRE